MKQVVFLIGMLLLVSGTGCKPQTQSQQEQVAKTATPPSQQPKLDSNNPATWPDALDATVAAPQNHKVVLENERVRVLEVTVQPGEREPVHGHKWPSVMYVMAEDLIRDYDAEGKLLYDSRTDKAHEDSLHDMDAASSSALCREFEQYTVATTTCRVEAVISPTVRPTNRCR